MNRSNRLFRVFTFAFFGMSGLFFLILLRHHHEVESRRPAAVVIPLGETEVTPGAPDRGRPVSFIKK